MKRRRCEFPGCVTILSSYNDGTFCWTHTALVPKSPLNRSTPVMSQRFIDNIPGTYGKG